MLREPCRWLHKAFINPWYGGSRIQKFLADDTRVWFWSNELMPLGEGEEQDSYSPNAVVVSRSAAEVQRLSHSSRYSPHHHFLPWSVVYVPPSSDLFIIFNWLIIVIMHSSARHSVTCAIIFERLPGYIGYPPSLLQLARSFAAADTRHL